MPRDWGLGSFITLLEIHAWLDMLPECSSIVLLYLLDWEVLGNDVKAEAMWSWYKKNLLECPIFLFSGGFFGWGLACHEFSSPIRVIHVHDFYFQGKPSLRSLPGIFVVAWQKMCWVQTRLPLQHCILTWKMPKQCFPIQAALFSIVPGVQTPLTYSLRFLWREWLKIHRILEPRAPHNASQGTSQHLQKQWWWW